jgi:sulfofructose kinase
MGTAGAVQSKLDCLVVGHAALDHVYRVDAIPVHATKVRALEHINAGGGMAANAAAAIARLGGRVELWSRVGGDGAGQAIRQALEDCGVDTTCVRTFEATRSSTAAVIVDGRGERLVVSERDHAMPMDTKWLPLDRVGQAVTVLSDLSWKEATWAAFQAARSHRKKTLLDIDLGAGVLPAEILRLTDYAIFSSGALSKFSKGDTTEKRCAWIADFGVRHVGVTEGLKGYWWRETDGRLRHQPAFAIDAIDTTGAGDAFHGAFAWAVSQDLESSECARMAAAAAALKCRRLGARAGLATIDEIDALLVTLTGRGIAKPTA